MTVPLGWMKGFFVFWSEKMCYAGYVVGFFSCQGMRFYKAPLKIYPLLGYGMFLIEPVDLRVPFCGSRIYI